MQKNILIIFCLFVLDFCFAQKSYFDYSNQNIQLEENGLIRMIDDLGFKFYAVTDSLLTTELNENFPSSKLKLLLEGTYEISNKLTHTISHFERKKGPNLDNKTFSGLRENTLLNLQKLSEIFRKKNDILQKLDFQSFTSLMISADVYCEEIISYRRSIRNPYIPLGKNINTQDFSENFDQIRGADGLTDDQWISIMRGGGGYAAPDLIRKTNRENQRKYILLKKQNRAKIEVGQLQDIKTFSNNIDGDIYIYRNLPPQQVSILYTTDNEIIKAVSNWAIFINAGNPTEITNIFRTGIDESIEKDKSPLSNYQINRKFEDHNHNQVALSLYPRNIQLSDTVEKVILMNYEIVFLNQENKPLFLIKNINGDLLERIKYNIKQMRNGITKYDDSLMNLSKY